MKYQKYTPEVTSDTSSPAGTRLPGSASDISGPVPDGVTPPRRRRPGAAATVVPERFAAVFTAYERLVARPGGPLDSDSVHVYCSRVRCYLTWLAGALAAGEVDGDPLSDPAARDWAARDYRRPCCVDAK